MGKPTVGKAVAQLSSDQRIIREIENLLTLAQPVTLQAGTMNVDRLAAALETIRVGLSEVDLQEIVAAMNEEYLDPTHES